jgi:hypothetical protein
LKPQNFFAITREMQGQSTLWLEFVVESRESEAPIQVYGDVLVVIPFVCSLLK